MGFVFNNGTAIVAGFKLPGGPIDVYSVVETRDDLNYPEHPTAPGVFTKACRFLGRTVFVVDEGIEYQLKQGITDADWEVKGGGDAPIISNWAANTDYVEGQIIWYNGQLYRANSTYKSGSTFAADAAKLDSASADLYTNTTPSVAGFGTMEAGTTFTNFSFADFMEKQFYPDIPPSVLFTASPSFALRERGVPLSGIVLSAEFSKTKYPIATVKFFRDGLEIDDAVITVPAGETITHTVSSETGLSNVVFSTEVTDTEGLLTTKAGSFTFVNPIYFGVVDGAKTAATITDTDITALTKKVATKSNQTVTYTASEEKFVIWVPDTWGTLQEVIDQNGYPILSAFESAPLTVENAASETVAGQVYVLKSETWVDSFTVTYQF